jgi:tetratricopeptide (TPR) repeat protein
MEKSEFNDHLAKIESSRDSSAIMAFLHELPDSSEYKFELYLDRLVEEIPEIDDKLEEIQTTDRYPTSVDEEKVKFASFYAICLLLLKQTNLSELDRHLSDFEHDYGNRPLYIYLRSRFLQKRGRPTAIKESVELSRTAVEEIPEHAGVAHCYAQSLALALENEYVDSDENEKTTALEKVQKALDEYPQNAEFYCTKGRLILISKGDHDRAKELIREAMDREDSTRPDYPLLMGEYQYHLSRIDSRKYDRELDSKLSEAISQINEAEQKTRERIEAQQSRTLQFLGFFAAILGVIITSAQILIQISLPGSLQLVLLLNGSLLVVFAGFTAMLPHEELPVKRIASAAFLGIILIGIAIGFYLL